jgi:iron-sulfur cluster assembly protein
MAISLTESAATRVRSYLQARGEGIGLRLGVTKTGCSGYSYVINYAEDITDADVVFSFRNPNVTGECGCGESFNV